MIITATFCDLCKGDGELVLAVCSYRTEDGHFHACEEHKEQVESYRFPTFKFRHLGDVDPSEFY